MEALWAFLGAAFGSLATLVFARRDALNRAHGQRWAERRIETIERLNHVVHEAFDLMDGREGCPVQFTSRNAHEIYPEFGALEARAGLYLSEDAIGALNPIGRWLFVEVEGDGIYKNESPGADTTKRARVVLVEAARGRHVPVRWGGVLRKRWGLMASSIRRSATVLWSIALVVVALGIFFGWMYAVRQWNPRMTSAELGDAMGPAAGLATALALAAAVVSVFMQSSELAAQREQLKAQLDELKQSREVMKEQADSQRKLSAAQDAANKLADRQTQMQRLASQVELVARWEALFGAGWAHAKATAEMSRSKKNDGFGRSGDRDS